MNHTAVTKRSDFYLRAEYPELITKIYRVEENRFVIHIENLTLDFGEFSKEFNDEIKLITAPVILIKDKPESYLEIISQISDDEISKGFEGILMSKIEWLNFLKAKFPYINFHKITDSFGMINIHIANWKEVSGNETKFIFLTKDQRQKLKEFIHDYNSSMTINIVTEEFDNKPDKFIPKLLENPVHNLYSSKQNNKQLTEYVKRDEALWFDNVDNIFEGGFKKENLYFFNENDYSCYVDFSVFPNIDLRNHLFLFQTVFLTPPFEKNIVSWLKESSIKKLEFIELVSRGRIKLILTQPYWRYDTNFIQEIYEAKPDSVISRRALSCLQQCDLVELSNNYILNDIVIINEVVKMIDIVSTSFTMDKKNIRNMLLWPIKARRNSFEVLHRKGLLSASVYGVNNVIQQNASELIKRDLKFEFTVNSPSIHLAHSLNAIYFPFKNSDGYSDSSYADIMGQLLNFFKNATEESLKEMVSLEKDFKKGNSFISPINFIKLNDYVPILELEEILNKDTIFPNSKRLIETLSQLTVEEQKQKIAFYNNEVTRIVRKKERVNNILDLSTNSLSDFAGSITGLPVGTIFSGFKIGARKIFDKNSVVKNITAKIDEVLNKEEDQKNIHFLSKVNRVAKLKNI